jgi:hypothetical protein
MSRIELKSYHSPQIIAGELHKKRGEDGFYASPLFPYKAAS